MQQENSQFLRALKEKMEKTEREGNVYIEVEEFFSCLEENWSSSEDQRREETEAEFNDFHSWVNRHNPSWAESWSKLIDLSEKLEEFNIFKSYKQKMKIFLAAPGIKNESAVKDLLARPDIANTEDNDFIVKSLLNMEPLREEKYNREGLGSTQKELNIGNWKGHKSIPQERATGSSQNFEQRRGRTSFKKFKAYNLRDNSNVYKSRKYRNEKLFRLKRIRRSAVNACEIQENPEKTMLELEYEYDENESSEFDSEAEEENLEFSDNELAVNFIKSQRNWRKRSKPGDRGRKKCHFCGSTSHLKKNCFAKKRQVNEADGEKNANFTTNDENRKIDKSKVTCFACGKIGHFKNECPEEGIFRGKGKGGKPHDFVFKKGGKFGKKRQK